MVPDTNDKPLTEFVGRDVYTTSGTHVGTATGVAVDLTDGLATSLTVTDLNPELFGSYPRDARGIHLPFRWVDAVGDIVVVASVVERFSPPGLAGSDEETADTTGAPDTTDTTDEHTDDIATGDSRLVE